MARGSHKSSKHVVRETSERLGTWPQAAFAGVLLLSVGLGLVFQFHLTLVVISGLCTLFYVLFVGMKIVLTFAAARYKAPVFEARLYASSHNRAVRTLPTYTVFVPLFKEANMLPGLVKAIDKLKYPKAKLQVLLLLEAETRDPDTLPLARQMKRSGKLPTYFEIVEIPDIKPYGKPKALNIGLERATGEFSVIFDAEDIPDTDQLLKAVDAFKNAPKMVACVQARLFFWNAVTSWVTRMYWMEYVVHFERVLPGFTQLGLIPPLGGTSNHFKTDVLREVDGWDGWNVTEDADLAVVLAQYGYDIWMIDSVTKEEATATVRIADGQRRRWLKGYLQTGLAALRHPLRMMSQVGPLRWFCFVLQMIGTPISLVLNPVFWGLTITYVITGSSFIESLYPRPIAYPSVVLMVACNFVLLVQLIGGCYRHEEYRTAFYVLLTPVWWLFTSWSMLNAGVELLIPAKRHLWRKTEHGHEQLRAVKKSSETSVVSPGKTVAARS